MTDLETGKGCDAHKAVTACIRAVKQKQSERDHEMQRVYDKIETTHDDCLKEIGSRVSMKFFMWMIGIIITILVANIGMNLSISRSMGMADTQLQNVTKNQDEIKVMIKTLFSRTSKE